MVVGSSAGNTDALAAAARSNIGVVDTDVHRTSSGDETSALGGALVDVLNESVGRISVLIRMSVPDIVYHSRKYIYKPRRNQGAIPKRTVKKAKLSKNDETPKSC